MKNLLFIFVLIICSSAAIDFSFSKPYLEDDLSRELVDNYKWKNRKHFVLPFINYVRTKHEFINIGLKPNSPILSMQKGKVIATCDTCKSGFGNYVIIQHTSSIKAQYFHLKSTSVKEGDNVNKGQEIGIQGNTGRCIAPNLGLKVFKNDTIINPLDLFKE